MNRNSSKPSKSSKSRKPSKSIAAVAVAAVATFCAVVPASAGTARGAEVKRLSALYAGATPGSPAQFRIHEELDRLAAEDVAGSAAATPPSAADFRLAEMKDR